MPTSSRSHLSLLGEKGHAKNNLSRRTRPAGKERASHRAGTSRSDRAVLLRPESTHRRQQLRPEHQPVQRDRLRRDRVPTACRNPCRARPRSKKRSKKGIDGSQGNVGMIAGWRDLRLGDVCELKYGKSLPKATRSGEGFGVFGSNGEVGRHNKTLTGGMTIIIGRNGLSRRGHVLV